jgi:Acyl-CoA reductase (LuxC)
VIHDPDPAPAPGCVNRVALVKPLDDVLAGLPDLVPLRRYLQTAVYALPPERARRLAEILAPAGVTRLAPLGRSQELPADARHDGVDAFQALVRWLEVEL